MSERAQKRKVSEEEDEEDEEGDVVGPLPVQATKPSRKKRGVHKAMQSPNKS